MGLRWTEDENGNGIGLSEIVLFGRSVQIDQRTLVDRVMMFRNDSNC